MPNQQTSVLDQIALENEQLMARFCVVDLEFALMQVELASRSADQHHQEQHWASAKHFYERAKGMARRVSARHLNGIDIRMKMERIEQALVEQNR